MGVDRDSEQTLISTSNCTPTTKLPTVGTAYYVDGHVLDGHILYLKLEHQFKPTEDVTFTGSEAVYTISNVKLGGSNFLWHDVQAYLNYSTIRPMGLYNNGNNLEICFRSSMPTFNKDSYTTLRLTFVTYVDLV